MSAQHSMPEPPRESASHPVQHPRSDDLGFELPPPATLGPTRAIAIALVVLVAMAGAFAVAYLPKRRAQLQLEQATHATDHSALHVDVVTPHLGAADRALTLPGSVRPLEETVIYPRANGYLRRWLVDMGDHVREGQLLAEIDTPELDQELAQARADLAQAEARVVQANATHDFAQSDLARYTQLAPSGIASRQDVDQRQAAAAVGTANVAVARAAVVAQRANIQRLLQLKSFARVQAPFAGMITARSIDRGALVTSGTSTPLFRLAAMDPARVFVQVPQDVAPTLRANVNAHINLREYPGRVFQGQIAHVAGALDSATRTMTAEIRVPNADGALLAGMYAEVSVDLPLPHRVFELPATAVLTDGHGVRIAIVTDEGTIHLLAVAIERDTGATVQISTGLTGSERVVRLAHAGLTEGAHVETSH